MISAGQLLGAVQGLGQIGVDIDTALTDKLQSFPADAAVGEDILGEVAPFWPPAALLQIALVVAVELEVSGLIKPDLDPEVDAQTTQSRGGRNS